VWERGSASVEERKCKRGRGEVQVWERGSASVGEEQCKCGRGEMQVWKRGSASVGEGNHHQSFWRYRVDHDRLICSMEDDIVILQENRKEVYKKDLPISFGSLENSDVSKNSLL
jgi:hypothetical protein